MKKYCVDSNFFITPWRTYYSPDVSPQYWEYLEKMAIQKKIIVPLEVFDEIKAGGDDLYDWLERRRELFVYEMNDDIQGELIKLFQIKEIQELIDTSKQKNLADPFVIAYGLAYNATIVLDDSRVFTFCKKNNISVIHTYDFVKENKIKFNVSGKV